MALTTDSTNAFDADAERQQEAKELRARLEVLEKDEKHPGGVIDENGDEINTSSTDVEVSAANEVEVAGTVFHYHTPNSLALQAFGIGAADTRDGMMQMKTMRRFLGFHIIEEDFDTLLERMSDPKDEEFGDDQFSELMNAIIKTAADAAEKQPKNGPANR